MTSVCLLIVAMVKSSLIRNFISIDSKMFYNVHRIRVPLKLVGCRIIYFIALSRRKKILKVFSIEAHETQGIIFFSSHHGSLAHLIGIRYLVIVIFGHKSVSFQIMLIPKRQVNTCGRLSRTVCTCNCGRVKTTRISFFVCICV